MFSNRLGKSDPSREYAKQFITTSFERCADDMEDCTDATDLDFLFLESDLNCDIQSPPSLSQSKEADLLLQELCEFETSVSWEEADFEPVRLLRTLPAPPPKRFYISRWRGFVERMLKHRFQWGSRYVASDMDVQM